MLISAAKKYAAFDHTAFDHTPSSTDRRAFSATNNTPSTMARAGSQTAGSV